MSAAPAERLYRLLPAVYRQRDFQQGEPLRALTAILERELRALEEDVERLYESCFIETCDEWVVPYLADLLGMTGLEDERSAVVSQRARVANALRYRRRKGTPAALEGLVHDVTGWRARVVELYELLATTQHLAHPRVQPRLGRGALFDLRSARDPHPLGGPFETAAHTADVRSITAGEGRYNLGNLALFVWRLDSYRIAGAPASRASGREGCYRFHPLGYDAPLFTRSRAGGEIARAAEAELPGPIRPGAFAADLAASRGAVSAFYGSGASLRIVADGREVPAAEVTAVDLGRWERPPGGRVAVDVTRGRLAFPEGSEPGAVEVSYHYGFGADLGGGPYDRRAGLTDPLRAAWRVRVAKGGPVGSLQQALDAWAEAGRPVGLVRFADSGTYGGLGLRIELPEGGELALEAEDGVRPCLRLGNPLAIAGPATGPARLRLDGLLVEGRLELEGAVDLRIAHSTLLPGRALPGEGERTFPAVAAVRATGGEVSVHAGHSIVGALRLPSGGRLTARDSVVGLPTGEGESWPAVAGVEGPEGSVASPSGPVTAFERCTVLGPVAVRELSLASEVLFTGPVTAERRQAGCVRFSYLPPGSSTPRRFRCQPELALQELPESASPAEREIVRVRSIPRFTSLSYGQAAFAQLARDCAPELRTGAEDGSELGVFRNLRQPQREANLREVLEESVPVGLDVGIFFVT
ncbi:MAG: phage tail protein [Acidobacteriota bacterium]|jgi:hypothetical protein